MINKRTFLKKSHNFVPEKFKELLIYNLLRCKLKLKLT